MKLCTFSIGLLAVGLASAALAAEHTKDSLEKVKQQLSDHKAVLLDVREPRETDEGRIKDAVLIPLSELKRAASDPAGKEKITKSLPFDRIIYCHCAKGVRALTAGSVLEKWGYDVRPLATGFDDLRAAGFETVKK